MSVPKEVFAEVRVGSLPWKSVDRRGFRAWVANMRKRGTGSARRPAADTGGDET